ncbi:putative phosphohydrolase [Thermobacillus composti KWC4]|uniref:Putative phosphohydrolase n=1 Tax=Thermobacillus composti (strain DSM 18247 / JCM 13945 / KWC4) TaxID=717605 RepID=L0EDM8_THECK|nr:metallophosphoesterase [Thermobacillus composti]AGA57739.1 putative phosphohydrolase [Thermobacillus composti KWC4]
MKRMLFALPLILILYIGLNVYIGWNLRMFLEWLAGPIPGAVFWIPFLLVAFGFPIGRIGRGAGPVLRLLKVAGAYYFALFEYGCLLLPPADIAGWLLREAGYGASIHIGVPGAAVAMVLLVLFITGSINAWSPVVREYRLEVPKDAGGLGSLRILAASDLHLGNIVGNRHLRRLIGAAEARKPDLILLAGDVIDDDIEPFIRNRMDETLGRLKAPYGIYAVLGNHEYYGGQIEAYVRRAADAGIRVLRDETVTIDGCFQIAGRKDKTAEGAGPDGRLPVSRLLEPLDPKLPILLMDHQPLALGEAAQAGADLLLSGHTHRGQFAPNHLVTRRLFELDWGYKRIGGMHALVSSGFGTWGPAIRLASRSELLDITLVFTGSQSSENRDKPGDAEAGGSFTIEDGQAANS